MILLIWIPTGVYQPLAGRNDGMGEILGLKVYPPVFLEGLPASVCGGFIRLYFLLIYQPLAWTKERFISRLYLAGFQNLPATCGFTNSLFFIADS
jgi:hypothetical protein